MGLGGDVAADLVEMHLHGGCVGEGEHESGTLGYPMGQIAPAFV